MEVKVTLLSWTKDPIQTVWKIWYASRCNDPIPNLENLSYLESKEMLDLFQKVLDSKIPVAENINFVFLLENISISLREQLVRHRIGVKVGQNFGVDIAPDISDSTWWSQSMRILDMGKFSDEGRYRIPESIKEKFYVEYKDLILIIQSFYREMVQKGIPMEDAREIIPLCATHRVTWSLNLSALQHIVGKRGCWILQLGLWKPVITGMVEELCTKVHPIFRNLINPPCISENKFKECVFKLDNERRVSGEDEIPPCSLYLGQHAKEKIEGWFEKADEDKKERFEKMFKEYSKLWNRDPWTGEDLK